MTSERTDTGSAFISELIRAANKTDRLTKGERARLLRRAADTLREYRHQINYSETPANDDGLNDPARNWAAMARLIDLFSVEEVSAKLLDAVSILKAARALLEEKRAIARGE